MANMATSLWERKYDIAHLFEEYNNAERSKLNEPLAVPVPMTLDDIEQEYLRNDSKLGQMMPGLAMEELQHSIKREIIYQRFLSVLNTPADGKRVAKKTASNPSVDEVEERLNDGFYTAMDYLEKAFVAKLMHNIAIAQRQSLKADNMAEQRNTYLRRCDSVVQGMAGAYRSIKKKREPATLKKAAAPKPRRSKQDADTIGFFPEQGSAQGGCKR